MTALKIYEIGVSYLPEQIADNPDLKRYLIPWMNVILQETFQIENSIRRYKGEEELLEAQVISSETEEIIYHPELAAVAFPFAIAANAFIDDDNDYRANIYRTLYQTRANEAMRYTPQKIKDLY